MVNNRQTMSVNIGGATLSVAVFDGTADSRIGESVVRLEVWNKCAAGSVHAYCDSQTLRELSAAFMRAAEEAESMINAHEQA